MRVVGPGGSWPERSCREDIGAMRRRDGVDDWEGAPAPATDSTAWPNIYTRAFGGRQGLGDTRRQPQLEIGNTMVPKMVPGN